MLAAADKRRCVQPTLHGGEGYAAGLTINFIEHILERLNVSSPMDLKVPIFRSRNLEITPSRSWAAAADADSRMDYTGVVDMRTLLQGEENVSLLLMLVDGVIFRAQGDKLPHLSCWQLLQCPRHRRLRF